ncbi:MAG: hypothetical protein HZC40_12055 [Chloroflexi bacterium]|nr:hypothetical protein [Chloroflexota bacterium]
MNWNAMLFDPTVFTDHLKTWFAALLGVYNAGGNGMLTPYILFSIALMIAGSILVTFRRATSGKSDLAQPQQQQQKQNQWRGD